MPLNERTRLRSLKRGLKALEYANLHGGSTVSQLSKTLALPRSTAHRILETLTAEGYLRKDESNNSYLLTQQVYKLSSGYSEESWIVDIARPLLVEFSKENGWPCVLATPLGSHMVLRAGSDYHTTLTLTRYPVGDVLPILATATGVAYLAFLDREQRSKLLKVLMGAASSSSVGVDKQEFVKKLLIKARQDGYYVISQPKLKESVVAIPLLVRGELRGGLAMRYIRSALEASEVIERYVPRLCKLAATINEKSKHLEISTA